MELIKFSATWCSPCKVLSNMLQNFKEVPLKNVDIENDTELVKKYNVRKVPTMVLVDTNGEELWRHVGVLSETDLIDKIRAV